MSVISNRKVDMNEAQDNVKQPAHYTYGDIEIIDFIRTGYGTVSTSTSIRNR
ncbi:hypothetical protein HMPREF0782_0424 [Staphylococcus aureus subsp. aureus ATCC 51811]|nr:hypothetical protein HMPREF0782_0424 [Staphylococcus aureus subsp. aureus ATCC 51811]